MDYAALRDTVKARLADKGLPLVYVRVTEDLSQLPEPGGERPRAQTRFECFGLKTAPTERETRSGIFAGTSLVMLLPGDVCGDDEPDLSDYLIFAGREWAITAIKPVCPGETAPLYKVGIRERGNNG